MSEEISVEELFPEKGKLVLSASGREFIQRLGIEAVRQVVLGVLCGENIRSQTEPLTRRRLTIVTGAMVALFVRGWTEVEDFTQRLPEFALEQMKRSPQSRKEAFWPAQWLLGLTTKGIQNVLRGDPQLREKYIQDFEAAIREAARQCEEDFGPVNLGYLVSRDGKRETRPLTWTDIAHLTTAIGAATLTIRGSEKSTYGKLFERLVLGSVLTILGFDYVESAHNSPIEKVFWLSDSSDLRECDATIRLRAGKLARFDIGFIGRGNPEIMKDKLTRYSSEIERDGHSSFSHTFIIVDKMPSTTRTLDAAARAGSEIIQMSMQYWPLDLARRLQARLGYEAEILHVPQPQLCDYLKEKLASIPILDFLGEQGEATASAELPQSS